MVSYPSIFVAFLAFHFALANTGEVTFFDPGLGACGITNTSNDLIVAVSQQFFDTFPGATPNPNLNPVCNKQLTAQYEGKSVTVTVTDKCPGCKGLFDLDLSPAAFQQLGDLATGRLLGVTWDFVAGKAARDVQSDVLEEGKKVSHRMLKRGSISH